MSRNNATTMAVLQQCYDSLSSSLTLSLGYGQRFLAPHNHITCGPQAIMFIKIRDISV